MPYGNRGSKIFKCFWRWILFVFTPRVPTRFVVNFQKTPERRWLFLIPITLTCVIFDNMHSYASLLSNALEEVKGIWRSVSKYSNVCEIRVPFYYLLERNKKFSNANMYKIVHCIFHFWQDWKNEFIAYYIYIYTTLDHELYFYVL